MRYEEMSEQQRREYGFRKLSKAQLQFLQKGPRYEQEGHPQPSDRYMPVEDLKTNR
ncbi:hypothetical protein J2T17_007131 [Paenibacillus mucilaginosus]|uniref:hypothetical protein n=1 Tax=Paenibacillus mucilaginosus TaxID=61624 RepID=UPI003D23C1FB